MGLGHHAEDPPRAAAAGTPLTIPKDILAKAGRVHGRWTRPGAPSPAPGTRELLPGASANLGDMPVPNSTELHHTQANIHQAAAQKIRCLGSPECVGVRAPNHLLISRVKVRFLHGSPLDRGAATPPDLFPGQRAGLTRSGRVGAAFAGGHGGRTLPGEGPRDSGPAGMRAREPSRGHPGWRCPWVPASSSCWRPSAPWSRRRSRRGATDGLHALLSAERRD